MVSPYSHIATKCHICFICLRPAQELNSLEIMSASVIRDGCALSQYSYSSTSIWSIAQSSGQAVPLQDSRLHGTDIGNHRKLDRKQTLYAPMIPFLKSIHFPSSIFSGYQQIMRALVCALNTRMNSLNGWHWYTSNCIGW